MKELTILLLGVVFVTLIAGCVQSISADHLELGGKGVFKDQDRVNFKETIDSDSKYQIHLQVEMRNAQGQLISVSETSHGNYIPYEISDFLFYEKLGVKPEIVSIDNIKYEKAQHVDPAGNDSDNSMKDDDEVDYILVWALILCGEIYGHDPKCMSVFQASTTAILVTQTDVITNQWTILRELN